MWEQIKKGKECVEEKDDREERELRKKRKKAVEMGGGKKEMKEE